MSNDIDDTFKGEGFVGGEIGEYFTIERNVLVGEGGYNGTVAPSVLPGPGLHAENPQFAPFTLFAPAVPIGVLPSLLHPTDGHAETVFGPTAVSLGVFQQCLVLCLGRERHPRECLMSERDRVNSV